MFVESQNMQNIHNKLERLREMAEIQTESDPPMFLSIQQILAGIEKIIAHLK